MVTLINNTNYYDDKKNNRIKSMHEDHFSLWSHVLTCVHNCLAEKIFELIKILKKKKVRETMEGIF